MVKWVTRKMPRRPRSVPVLIKRFIDPDAEFLYAEAEQVMAVAEAEGATPSDVKDVELGHVDGRCSFDSILLKYELQDPALDRPGEPGVQ